jgi:hypothetical protein
MTFADAGCLVKISPALARAPAPVIRQERSG